jgi:cytochrome c oxidase assembly protein subunit 15
MGGLVTSYRAGMAVPDWPNTFGYNLFLYPLESWIDVFDVLLEHSHRLIGAAVGLVAIALAIALWVVDRRPAARWLGIAAVAGVSLQGTLGGLRVILDETPLADLHGCTAALYFALAAALVTYTSPAWRVAGGEEEKEEKEEGGRRKEGDKLSTSRRILHPSSFILHPFPWLPMATAIAVYLQIVLGAQLRHLTPQQGPGWFALWVWLHVIMAGLLVLAVVWLLVLTGRRSGAERMLSRRAKWLAAALAVQLTLAAATWVTHYGWPAWLTGAIGAIPYTVVASGRLQAFTTTAHVVVGSLCLAAALSLALWDRRQRAIGSRQTAAGSRE